MRSRSERLPYRYLDHRSRRLLYPVVEGGRIESCKWRARLQDTVADDLEIHQSRMAAAPTAAGRQTRTCCSCLSSPCRFVDIHTIPFFSYPSVTMMIANSTTTTRKANLFESMALGGMAASFAVNFTHPIVRSFRSVCTWRPFVVRFVPRTHSSLRRRSS